jgi:hypothetical protein
MTSTRLARALVLPVVVGLSLTACGPDTDAEIAMRATALDLQFARPDLAEPVPPTIIVKLLPAPSIVLRQIERSDPPPLPPTPSAPPVVQVGCPPAGEPGSPGVPLAQSTTVGPAAGFYTYATVGTGSVSGSPTDVTSAALPTSTFSSVTATQQVAPGENIELEGGAQPTGKVAQYTVTTALSDTVNQVDVLQVSATSVNLVRRTLTNAERTVEFTPTPAVQVLVFGAVGTTWSSQGVDEVTGASMDYAGSIDAETDVTICGVTTKAFTVGYSSTLTLPLTSEVIRTGTDAAHPSSFTIAPQLGGLLLAERVYSEDVRLYRDLSGYVGTTLDYSSTLTNLTPETP